MKCLIVGDLHYGKSLTIGRPPVDGKLNSRLQDKCDLLEWIAEYCDENNIYELIITGDVFEDYRPHPAVIGLFAKFLKDKSWLNTHIILGNHDIIRSGQYIYSALDLIGEMGLAKIYKDFSYIRLEPEMADGSPKLGIGMIPFRDKRMYDSDSTEDALTKLKADIKTITSKLNPKDVNIAIGHLALEGSLSVGDEIADSLNEIYAPASLFNQFSHVWMGHIHHPQVIQHENPYAAHVGSLDRSDFSKTETDNPKVMIEIDTESDTIFEEVQLPVRPLRLAKIEVPSGKDSTDFVINDLCLQAKKDEYKDAIVALEIQLNGADIENTDRKKIENYLVNNLGIHYLCRYSESRSISVVQIDPEKAFDNTMKIKQTINKWAEHNTFDSDDQKSGFLSIAHECRSEYEEKYNK